MQPDPRRYDKVEQDGKTLYVDKYLRTAFSLDVMAAGAWAGVPGYSFQPRIESTIDYAEARQSALASEMSSGEYAPPAENPREHHEIASGGNERGLGFLSVDICGASAMRRKNPTAFDRAYELFTRELGTLVGQFNGSILKTKGDGFIAFIDHPSFTNLCDHIIDMGLSLLILLHRSLNPALLKAGMEPLSIRIGADYGEALVRQLTIPSTGFVTQEVASDALNRAVKIEEACPPNQFWIGRCLYELIHVKWLERATETAFDGASVGMPDYTTYRMT
jgi:class 3 adenylate cyclase